jgi:hypothetical protein
MDEPSPGRLDVVRVPDLWQADASLEGESFRDLPGGMHPVALEVRKAPAPSVQRVANQNVDRKRSAKRKPNGHDTFGVQHTQAKKDHRHGARPEAGGATDCNEVIT